MGKNLLFRKTSSLVYVALGISLALTFCVPSAMGQSASAQTQAFNQNVKEVYFPFNIYNRVIDQAVLDANATWLKQNPDGKLWIQGYADPRGDIVYNLVLSYHRAQWIKSQLVKRGVDGSQIEFATGWGKLYQTCEAKDENCFQQNRRADVVPAEAMMFHGGQ